jgi:hypothetical protein
MILSGGNLAQKTKSKNSQASLLFLDYSFLWGEQDYFMIRRVGTLRTFLKQKNAQVNLAFFLI